MNEERNELSIGAGVSTSSVAQDSDDNGAVDNDGGNSSAAAAVAANVIESDANEISQPFTDGGSLTKATPGMQSLEIDMGGDETVENGNKQRVTRTEYLDDDDDSDSDAELNELLRNNQKGANQQLDGRACCGLCPQAKKVGNMYIAFPEWFDRTKWGIVGPHYFGPVCVILLLIFASTYFIRISISHDGPITTAICVLFAFSTTYNLINCAYRDPGVVKLQKSPATNDEENRLQFRWCDFCACYQPPDGAHCPNCNVCIAGFDHHCVWMGTCIGRNNFKQFVLFNLSWLSYLAYAVIWVSLLGPIMHHTIRKKGGDV